MQEKLTKQRAEERKKRLQKFHNLNFQNQVVLQALEDEPAYKRQGMELDEIEHSSSEPGARITLDSKEENIEIKNNNSFFHLNFPNLQKLYVCQKWHQLLDYLFLPTLIK